MTVLFLILMFATPHFAKNCKQPADFVSHKKTSHAIQFYFEPVFKPNTITNIFIFKEDTPFVFFIESYMNGLGWTGLIYTRSACVIPYAVMVCLRYFLTCFPCVYTSHRMHRVSNVRLKRYKRRRYIALRRRYFWVNVVVVPLFILLLLCGDVHPHPGPVLPNSRRHPGSRLLIVASWNVGLFWNQSAHLFALQQLSHVN